jgi:hypothetical protein
MRNTNREGSCSPATMSDYSSASFKRSETSAESIRGPFFATCRLNDRFRGSPSHGQSYRTGYGSDAHSGYGQFPATDACESRDPPKRMKCPQTRAFPNRAEMRHDVRCDISYAERKFRGECGLKCGAGNAPHTIGDRDSRFEMRQILAVGK